MYEYYIIYILYLKKNNFKHTNINIILFTYLLYVNLLKNIKNNYMFGFWYEFISILNTENNIIFIYFLIMCIYTYNLNKYTNIKMYVFVYIFYINVIYFEKTNTLYVYNTINDITNFNLINGVMLIHPILLYIFYSIVFYIVIIQICSIYKNTYHKNTLYVDVIKTIIIYFAFILGCYWAEQELSWGGWWSWDFVEIISISLLIISIMSIHQNKYNKSILKKYFFLKKNFLTIMLAIVFVKYNLINSLHNFILINSQIQYDVYIYMFIYIIIFFCIFVFFIDNLSICFYVFLFHIILIYMFICINNLIVFKSFLILTFLCLYIIYILLYFFKYNIKYTNWILLYSYYFITMVDVICLILCKKIILKKQIPQLHIYCILIFVYVIHQIYVFDKQTMFNIHTVCLKFLQNIFNNTHYLDVFYINEIFLKNNLIFNTDINIFKKIFEKTYFNNFNLISGVYNYNNYNIIQVFLPILLLFCLNILRYLIYFIKNNINYKISI